MDDQRDARERTRRGKSPPTNLPSVRGSLIGREHELATARGLLLRADVGLLTVTGAGGSGKTRLALQLAADVLDHFEDGVSFVSLAEVSDPGLVGSTIARTLGLREGGDGSILDSLLHHIRSRNMLLLLDNFEQVLPAGELVARMLAASPRLKILVTSRAVLQVRGEHEFVVPPLALPNLRSVPGHEELVRNPAVALFVERASAVRPSFRLTDGHAPAVAEIVVRLDGLPLAIELAAARLRVISPGEILAKLDRRLPLLTSGTRDMPSRQRTLRDAIAWSYDLLPEPEQRLFRRLAVFVGGVSLEAAGSVTIAGEVQSDLEVLDGVTSLVEKSLLRQVEQGDGRSRFVMLETIREYGLERLDASGEAADLRRRHAGYYIGMAERGALELWGAEEGTWLRRLECEHDNLRAALARAGDDAESAELALRLAAALQWFWYARGYLTEGRRWLRDLLAESASAPLPVRACALVGLGLVEQELGEYQQAAAHLDESRTLYRLAGDGRGMAWSGGILGLVALRKGHYEAAATRFHEALALARDAGSAWLVACTHYWLGQLAEARGETEAAGSHFETASSSWDRLGVRVGFCRSLAHSGVLAHARGETAQAVPLLERSLALARDAGDAAGLMFALDGLGQVLHARGDDGRAVACFREGLTRARDAGSRRYVALATQRLGQVALSRGDLERAARLFGAAEALREAMHMPIPIAEHVAYDRILARLKATLDDATWRSTVAEGRAMVWEKAIEYALGESTLPARPTNGAGDRRATDARSSLTPREHEVAALIARGYTNRQVADTLVITERTAETHARNVREKLGVRTRSGIAAWATAHGLVSGTAPREAPA
jgi:predicted ATPase/DNA-binding CsgD family transcriptional regulator